MTVHGQRVINIMWGYCADLERTSKTSVMVDCIDVEPCDLVTDTCAVSC